MEPSLLQDEAGVWGGWMQVTGLASYNILIKCRTIMRWKLTSFSSTPHFRFEEIKVQKSKITWPRWHSPCLLSQCRLRAKNISHFLYLLCFIILLLHQINKTSGQIVPQLYSELLYLHHLLAFLFHRLALSPGHQTAFSHFLWDIKPSLTPFSFVLCSPPLLTSTVNFKNVQVLSFFVSNYHLSHSFPLLPNSLKSVCI